MGQPRPGTAVSPGPSEGERPWPPLITEGPLSRWVYARDILLTVLMWFFFLLLMAGEIERLAAPALDRLGIPTRAIGYADLTGNWYYFLYALAPFLAIALFLVTVLASFAVYTVRRRRRRCAAPGRRRCGSVSRRATRSWRPLPATRARKPRPAARSWRKSRRSTPARCWRSWASSTRLRSSTRAVSG